MKLYREAEAIEAMIMILSMPVPSAAAWTQCLLRGSFGLARCTGKEMQGAMLHRKSLDLSVDGLRLPEHVTWGVGFEW